LSDLLIVQYYLPDETVVTKDFLKEVLAGQKQLMKKADVKAVQVPQYDELSVRNLWPEMKKDAHFLSFFPTKYPKDKGPPRDYFFDVLNTLYPEYLQQLMANANEARMAAGGPGQQSESIKISQFWEEELKAMPYLSCKSLVHYLSLIVLSRLQRRMGRPCICLRLAPSRPVASRSARRCRSSAHSRSTQSQSASQRRSSKRGLSQTCLCWPRCLPPTCRPRKT